MKSITEKDVVIDEKTAQVLQDIVDCLTIKRYDEALEKVYELGMDKELTFRLAYMVLYEMYIESGDRVFLYRAKGYLEEGIEKGFKLHRELIKILFYLEEYDYARKIINMLEDKERIYWKALLDYEEKGDLDLIKTHIKNVNKQNIPEEFLVNYMRILLREGMIEEIKEVINNIESKSFDERSILGKWIKIFRGLYGVKEIVRIVVSPEGKFLKKEIFEAYSQNEVFDLIGFEWEGKNMAFILPKDKELSQYLKDMFLESVPISVREKIEDLWDYVMSFID